MAMMPKLTPEGHRILIYRLADTDYRKMIFSEGVKAFCMVNDCILSEDKIIEGYIVIFDMKGVALGHLARVSLPALRIFMHYIQEAHPARLKAIHILNTASFIHHVMRLLIPLLKTYTMDIVKFHQGPNPDGIPIDLLPSDYGGEQESISTIHKRLYAKMMDKYTEWFKQGELLRVDESKRPKKISWLNIFTNPGPKEEASFRALAEID